ncbi:GPN-loop GTPase 3 [Nowakowskiella sp. JEL0078]|nr:GPN-loop GTPase 3 [Nowakowskiella sp. JEL0078]
MCQLVMGPAGSGKVCSACPFSPNSPPKVYVLRYRNLPHHEQETLCPSHKPGSRCGDIKDLITLDDVMEELHYGPNGGLIYCMEYLINNMDWLEEKLDDFDDDYIIIDCPGQIELYTHFPIMRQLVDTLQRLGYRVCGIYVLDSQFIQDTPKFFAGVMSAMSAMIQLEIPHINILSKIDLLGKAGDSSVELERFFESDPSLLVRDANTKTSSKFHALNEAMVNLIDQFNLVNFLPLNIKDEESIELILSHIDNSIQYGEDIEPKELNDDLPDDQEMEEDQDFHF